MGEESYQIASLKYDDVVNLVNVDMVGHTETRQDQDCGRSCRSFVIYSGSDLINMR